MAIIGVIFLLENSITRDVDSDFGYSTRNDFPEVEISDEPFPPLVETGSYRPDFPSPSSSSSSITFIPLNPSALFFRPEQINYKHFVSKINHHATTTIRPRPPENGIRDFGGDDKLLIYFFSRYSLTRL